MATVGNSSGYVNESNKTYYYPLEMEQEQQSSRRSHLLPKLLIGGGCFLLILVIFVRCQESAGPSSVNERNTELYTASLLPKESVLKGSTIETEQVNNNTHNSKDSKDKLYKDFCPRLEDKSVDYNKTNDKIYFTKLLDKGQFQTSTTDSEIIKRLEFQTSFQDSIDQIIKLKQRKKVILTLSLLDQNDIARCSNSTLKYVDNLCEFTTDTSRFEEADVIIFREKDLHSSFVGKRYNKNQLWIYNNPSPHQSSSLLPLDKSITNIFNLTGTYDFRSHLPMLPMYWKENITFTDEWTYENKTVTDNQLKVTVFNKDCKEENIFRNKYKQVIEELESNNVTVEWFGNCNESRNHKSDCDNLSSAMCYEEISTKSKFALAFETAEVDFISERFFDPLRNYVVPIVIGQSSRGKYKALSPKNSFIDYCDFKTISELAKHLELLNKNDMEYKKYFLDKGSLKSYKRWYCQVCSILFRRDSSITTVDNINDWIN